MTKQSTALINPQDLLKKQLATANERVDQSDSNKIKISVATGFTAPDGTEGRNIEVVVIDFRMVNSYYDKPYDANNYSPPACYAAGKTREQMAPVATALIPQAETCAKCDLNKFKSGIGNAKACKNTRELAVVPANNIKDGPIWLLSVPPNATGRWDKYTIELASEDQLTPLFVVTRAKQPKAATYASPFFEKANNLTEGEIIDAAGRMAEAEELLSYIPDFSDNKAA